MKRRLPFPGDSEYMIAKPTGRFAHENWPECYHAVDFLLGLGSPLAAVEDGVVERVKNDSSTALVPEGLDELNEKQMMELSVKYTNYVRLKYDDGRHADYVHIGKDVLVAEGDKVKKGQVIGYVGMNGITSEPHLHYNEFIIQWCEIIGYRALSVPVKFDV